MGLISFGQKQVAVAFAILALCGAVALSKSHTGQRLLVITSEDRGEKWISSYTKLYKSFEGTFSILVESQKSIHALKSLQLHQDILSMELQSLI
jgi:hypothetical protein